MPELCVCSGCSMKILILGCGQVGSAVAKSLAQQPNNAVTVIDINATSIQRLSDSLDIQTLIGSCTSPHILQAAYFSLPSKTDKISLKYQNFVFVQVGL